MAILVEFQHASVLADIDRKKIWNVVRMTCTQRRRMCLLKDLKVRMRFEEKAIKLNDFGVPNLWGHFKEWILRLVMWCVGRRMEEK